MKIKKSYKEKIILSLIILLYILSFLLPYMKIVSSETFDYVSKTGIQLIDSASIWYIILLVLTTMYIGVKIMFKKYSIIFASFLFAYFLYLATLPFISLISSNVPLSYYWQVPVHLFQVGYYINSLLGLALGGYLIKISLNKNEQ